MAGYTPVFSSVFTGTLHGQYPDTAAWLFLLALADRYGEIDMTPAYISSVTGMPQADLEACIARFMRPDPLSRSRAHDGRRLVLLDENRAWGWRIVNYSEYRERARLAAKSASEVASGRNAKRLRDRRSPPLTAADPPSDTDTDTDIESTTSVDISPQDISLPQSSTSQGGVQETPPAPTKANGRKAKASRLVPDDWAPSTKLLQRIAAENVADCLARGGTTIELELERFRSCTFGTPRSDWDRTAWNWLLTECKRINQREAMYGVNRQTKREK